jgi:hypothetical protein
MPLPFLVSLLINIAIGVGLSYVSSKLQKKEAEKAKKKAKTVQQEDTGGSILEIQYGEGQPRLVAIGKVATAGVAVYDNSFNTANKTLQRVFKLSDFYTTALTRVAINNAWVTLGSLDATKGYPVTSGDYNGLIWVKFLDGRQTSADSYLTGNDNPDGRWTTDHKGIGVSYAIVTLEYDDEKLNSIPEILFEFTGAPLYDLRKDTSVGGSGSHRWNDVTTWEYSANPVLAEYCYRMGFYTGTYGSGHDRFCGMGYSQAELDYARYDAAADICDETVEGENRYVVSMFLDATRDHGDNVEDLMLSCAGMVVEGVSGPFPILGASQTPVATLTNDDLIASAPVVFAPKRPVSEIVNTVSGNYIEPSLVYAETGYSAQTLAGTVTADRRTIDFNLNFPMVPSKRQAEQLASIYFSENRYEATKTVLVHMKWICLEVGDWITWTDDEDGAASRDYQIVGMGIAELSAAEPRAVQLTLQERDDSIYAGIGAVAAPTQATKPGTPTYLQELQSFSVAAINVVSDSGYEVPAIAATWTAVSDVTVDAILIEWRPTGDSARMVSKVINRSATVAILQEGVVGATEYQVRNTIIPRPARTTTPSAWSTVTTNVAENVTFDVLGEDIRETLELMRRDITRIFEESTQTALGLSEAMISKAEEVLARRTLRAQVGAVSATVVEEQAARIEGDTALASSLTAVEAKADQGSASGFFKIEATAAPGGVTARFGTYLRASIEDNFTAEAAEYLEIVDGTTRKVIVANQTAIADTGGNIYALFDSTGAYLDNARIRNLTSSNIQAGSITAGSIAAGAITASKISAGTITANEIISGGISTPYSTGSSVQQSTTSLTYQLYAHATLSINVPAGARVLVIAQYSGATASPNATNLQAYIARNGAQISFLSRLAVAFSSVAGGSSIQAFDEPPAGVNNYQLYFRTSNSGNQALIADVSISAIVIRR